MAHLASKTKGTLGPIAAIAIAAAMSACSWNPPDASRDRRGVAESHVAASREGASIVSLAERMVGVPYVYGGHSPKGFDCSGLVYYAYRQTGVDVPRTSIAQFKAAKPIPLGAARPGDLVFFRIGGNVSHVGIYVGDNRFIHSPETGQTVKITDLDNSF